MNKKYYWLKLKRDFFKRHDIQIIESMPNGKDYILFYLKLLCESIDHDGRLRFNDEIPYNEQMLATITNTNVDIVKNAINLFANLDMMDIMDDGTYYMSKVEDMTGSETYWAKKKREQRIEYNANKQLDNVQLMSNSSPICPSKSIDIDKDIYVFKTKDKDFFVKESDLQRYKDVYPFVDVEQELKKMGLWLDSNVSKRKTHKGMPRFINNWLNNCKPKETPSYIDEIPEI